jgi:hypothetical protein
MEKTLFRAAPPTNRAPLVFHRIKATLPNIGPGVLEGPSYVAISPLGKFLAISLPLGKSYLYGQPEIRRPIAYVIGTTSPKAVKIGGGTPLGWLDEDTLITWDSLPMSRGGRLSAYSVASKSLKATRTDISAAAVSKGVLLALGPRPDSVDQTQRQKVLLLSDRLKTLRVEEGVPSGYVWNWSRNIFIAP